MTVIFNESSLSGIGHTLSLVDGQSNMDSMSNIFVKDKRLA